MILVVEGPSAAGKTTWLAQWDPATVVAEHGRVEPPVLPAASEAHFWADLNATRWRHAVDTEGRWDRALCDTDPLKLHYDFCRARVDTIPWSRFDDGVRACRQAIGARQLGIADLILCDLPDVATLDDRKQRDTSRPRRNFDLHRRFGPALHEWYSTLDALDPGRVEWTFPVALPTAHARDRYDLDLFDQWMSQLPHRPGPVR